MLSQSSYSLEYHIYSSIGEPPLNIDPNSSGLAAKVQGKVQPSIMTVSRHQFFASAFTEKKVDLYSHKYDRLKAALFFGVPRTRVAVPQTSLACFREGWQYRAAQGRMVVCWVGFALRG